MDNRIWHKQYPKNMAIDIDLNAYSNVIEVLEETFQQFKKVPAFSNFGKTMDFQTIDQASTHFGAYLQAIGLKKGDKIAIMMPNLLQYPIALYGAIKAGIVVVNTNPLYTPREMLHQFEDAQIKGVIIAENFAHNLEKILPKIKLQHIITTGIGDLLGGIKAPLINFVVKHIKKMVPAYTLPKHTKFKDALKKGAKLSLKKPDIQKEDTLLIQYTGGTTGVAKGAMLSHKNLIANLLQVREVVNSGTDIQLGKETAMCPLPIYHIFAFTTHCLSLFSLGVHNVLITNPRDLKSLAKDLNKYPIGILTGVNTLFNAMANNEHTVSCRYDKLRITIGGGMAVQKAVAESWEKLTGCPITEGYGLTETSPVLCVNPVNKGRIGTIGTPVSSTDVRIVNDKGEVVPQGERGELQAKGPQIMSGYYNRPLETERNFQDGWFCTGDIATMCEDGFFRIVDRKKDMILVSGFNVYPNEIEEVAVSHPKVLEAAAVGVPDDKSSEAVKLFIVTANDDLSHDELINFLRENLTGYKIPKHIEFRKELPKSNVGKILRRILREESI